MKHFIRICNELHNKNKSNLCWLYNEPMNTVNPDAETRIFSYKGLTFYFSGVHSRKSDMLWMHIEVQDGFLECMKEIHPVVLENYLLAKIYDVVETTNGVFFNKNKAEELPHLFVQTPGNKFTRKSSVIYRPASKSLVINILCKFPLFEKVFINSKSVIKFVSFTLEEIYKCFTSIDSQEILDWDTVYSKQTQIRAFLRQNNAISFIANGSILPRNTADGPREQAVPFLSPGQMETSVVFRDGTLINGMLLTKGITTVIGEGYSGKSTILKAIENGIYNHIPGSGTEYVITDETAVFVSAEEGRRISHQDLSYFFESSPESDYSDFCTECASGSTSQAANLIEAVQGECRVVLIDEDKSAVNFLKKSRFMAVNKPLIDCIAKLKETLSFVLAIGSLDEYIDLSDTVLVMKNYNPVLFKSNGPFCPKRAVCLPFTKKRALTADIDSFLNIKFENGMLLINEKEYPLPKMAEIESNEQKNLLIKAFTEILYHTNPRLNDILQYIKSIEFDYDNPDFLCDGSRLDFLEEVRYLDIFLAFNKFGNNII